MKSGIGQIIFTVVAVALAVLFIGLTLRQTDFPVLKAAAAQADYKWFLFSMILSVYSYWLRAIRWKLLLEPMGYKISAKSGFWAISFSYFLNLTIPRSGEIARATSLYKMEKVPIDKSLGMIILERVIDLLFLGLFFLLALIFKAEALFSFLSFSDSGFMGKIGILVSVAALFGILFFFIRKYLRVLKVYRKIEQFLRGIWEGVKSILHLREKFKFILYSFGIWFCYFLMTYLVIFAFPETSVLGLGDGFFLIVASAFGMILPAVGGLAYPYVVSLAFAAIYISNGQEAEAGKTVGNYFGLMLYFAQIITMIAFGLLSIYFIGKISGKKS